MKKIYIPTLGFYQFLILQFLIVFVFSYYSLQNNLKKEIKIYVSFNVIENITNTLTKNSAYKIKVIPLIAPHADHHHFHLSAKQLADLRTADLVILNGSSFESDLDQSLKKHKEIKIHYVTQSPLKKIDLMKSDPHVWLSLNKSLDYIKSIAEALKQNNLVEDAILQKNLQEMEKEILEFQSQLIRPQFIKAPVVLTAYNILTYFNEDLNFESIALSKDHNSNDLNAKTYKSIVDRIKSKDIQSVVTELNGSSKILKKMKTDYKLNEIGPLCIDSLSSSEGPCSTYIQMLKYNYKTLSAGLINGGNK